MYTHPIDKPDEPSAKIAQVLFTDIVKFTQVKRMLDQLGVRNQLTDIVRSTSEYRLKDGTDSVICRSTGDGMALVFFDDPAAPIRCAIEIAGKVKRQTRIALRMGIHSGPVYRHPDIAGQPDVTGEGINIAERVMSGGDPNHILLSRAMGDILMALGEWNNNISKLIEIEGKHGLRLQVYNFSGDGFGNRNFPTKRVPEGETTPIVGRAHFPFGGEPSQSATTEQSGSSAEPPTEMKTLGQGRFRDCPECGMLLRADSRWCIHCGCRYG